MNTITNERKPETNRNLIIRKDNVTKLLQGKGKKVSNTSGE